MWLFDSKLHETFPWINIDGYWCETHEDIPITPAKHISWKGPICKARVGPWHLHHHLICHVEAQTYCLTGGKHLGCYSLPPLKESRPEIRCERLLRKRDMLPVSNISDSFRLHSFKHQRDQIGRDNFLYLFFVVNFCQKNFLHWLP